MDWTEFLSFRRFITPLAIQIIFWIGVLFVIIAALTQMFHSFGSFVLGIIGIIAGIVLVRIYCELLILLFRIYDELVALRTGAPPVNGGFPVKPVEPMPATPGAPIAPPTMTT
jgi:hypothetical protein